MPSWFAGFIVIWTFVLFGLMCIGGYFMFRKFLKIMPKQDGKSDLDWQNYYVDKTRHLWSEEMKAFLEELVKPVPSPFRDVARHSIAAKIGKLALEEKANAITQDIILRGYIMATPKRDHKWLVAYLETKQLDYKPYLSLMKKSGYEAALNGRD
jgi:hypothetical protein